MKAIGLAWLFMLHCAQVASAAEMESLSRPEEIGGVPTAALPSKINEPKYPMNAEAIGMEGWVVVSYTIDTGGKVIEAMIEDSSGMATFEDAALQAVQKWQFVPANLNGVPVEQSMTRVNVTFSIKDRKPGAGPEFARHYRAIEKLVVAKDLAKAAPLLTDLEDRAKHNLYEDAWFWLLKYRYLAATGTADNHLKRACLRKALGYDVEYLAADEFVAASQELYRLAVEARDYSEALATFERLDKASSARKSGRYAESHKLLEQNVAILRDMVASDQTLSLDARIERYGYWHHTLLRRSFAINDVAGRIDLVDIRCDRRTQRFSMSTVSTWTIPASWGTCRVYLKGEDGTTFTFHELPLAASAR
ncbi:MAG: energy transducer TonB [Gammaproteobacteria bacterium]|nr:energy transducer TonB [Gammaproteobacteria bacterium]